MPIDGHGSNKLNAAFAFGGASLLVKTVEQVTGLHIDHYAEIGFDGFATMVDAVGGVRLCLTQAIDDGNAGINLPAGCQSWTAPRHLAMSGAASSRPATSSASSTSASSWPPC